MKTTYKSNPAIKTRSHVTVRSTLRSKVQMPDRFVRGLLPLRLCKHSIEVRGTIAIRQVHRLAVPRHYFQLEHRELTMGDSNQPLPDRLVRAPYNRLKEGPRFGEVTSSTVQEAQEKIAGGELVVKQQVRLRGFI
jgi:hypothetical protein